MSPTWLGEDPPPPEPLGLGGWFRVATKGTAVMLVLVLGVLATLLLRWTGAAGGIRQRVTQATLWLVGLRVNGVGAPLATPGAMVANHSSWLDIFVLNSLAQATFVSKDGVREWPLIGWLARLGGTVFIDRDPREVKAHQAVLEARLAAGERLVLFPEGTSSDGLRVLPFKSSLFAAFQGVAVQPVTVVYTAPKGADPRLYAWWGDMEFGPHLLQVLGQPRHGSVTVTYHTPIPTSQGRKARAQLAEDAVNGAFPSASPP